MKFLIITLLFQGLFLGGCMSKIPRLTPAPNSPPPVHKVDFEEIDLNEDGNITKEEFAQIPQSPEINTTTPVIWFVILIILIGCMVFLTKFIRNKD